MSRNMRVRLTTADGQKIEYSPAHGFGPAPDIPCFRCGVCCLNWQPPVDTQEAKKIARALGMPYAAFSKKFLQKYPIKEGYLIRRENNACVFLKFEDGLGGCVIHRVRPEACRNWQPGLEKPECKEGLRQMADTTSLMTPADLKLAGDDLAGFYRAVVRPADKP